MPSTVPVPASAEAAALIVPSPPPTITNGSPRLATAAQRLAISSPANNSTLASMPARFSALRTSPESSGFAASAPPPRLSRTGTLGGGP